jgi:cell division protein FtsA
LAYARGRLVLTGGASQLVGLPEFASAAVGHAVRVGRPRALGAMPDSLTTPAFATAVGLVLGALSPRGLIGAYEEREVLMPGYLGRVGQWIRESF